MKQTVAILSLFLIALCSLSSCKTAESGNSTKSLSYIVADHYFVKNNVEVLPQGAITTEDAFHTYFGEAPVMGGKDALPTPINFKKQFAIAVCVPETDIQTDITPVSLHKAGKDLVFTYKVTRGAKRSYTTQPLLLIFVDKKYEGKVVLKQQ